MLLGGSWCIQLLLSCSADPSLPVVSVLLILSGTQASLPALYGMVGSRSNLSLPLHPTKWPEGWELNLDLIRCDIFLEGKG